MDSQRHTGLPTVVDHDQDEQNTGLPALAMDPKELTRALSRYKANRTKLLRWLDKALIEGVDYGRIHNFGKKRCPHGDRCGNPFHWSKKILFKPGGEKILGYLNYRPRYPNIGAWELRMIETGTLGDIMLSCEIVNAAGEVVGEGVGARTADQDRDPNKRVKMAKKSSMLDAVLSTAGLSEMFTQDINEQPGKTGDMLDDQELCPIGPWRGKPITQLSNEQIVWVLKESDDPDLRQRLQEIQEERRSGGRPKSSVEQVAQDPPDGGEITMSMANTKLMEAIGVDELQRVFDALPERVATPLRKVYETRRADLGGGR